MNPSGDITETDEEETYESKIDTNRYLQHTIDRQLYSQDNWSSEKAPKVELKQLQPGLKYAFLYDKSYPVIVSANLSNGELALLLNKLRKHRKTIGYSLEDIPGISQDLCMHHIHLEDDSKSSIEHQRRLTPNLKDVVKKETIKLLDAGVIYPISDSNWVRPVLVVAKKRSVTVVKTIKTSSFP